MSKHQKSISAASPADRGIRLALSDRAKRLSAHLLQKHNFSLKHTHALDALAAADGHANRQAGVAASISVHQSHEDPSIATVADQNRPYDVSGLIRSASDNPDDLVHYAPFMPISTRHYAGFIYDLASKMTDSTTARIALNALHILQQNLDGPIAVDQFFDSNFVVASAELIMTKIVKIGAAGVFLSKHGEFASWRDKLSTDGRVAVGQSGKSLKDLLARFYGSDENDQGGDVFIDCRGVEMPFMSFREAVTQIHLISHRYVDHTKSETDALDLIHDLIIKDCLDDLPVPVSTDEYSEQLFFVSNTFHPALNPLRICLQIGQRLAVKPGTQGWGVDAADRCDREQQAIEIMQILIMELAKLT